MQARNCILKAATAVLIFMPLAHVVAQDSGENAGSSQLSYWRNMATDKCLVSLPAFSHSIGVPLRIQSCDFNTGVGTISRQKWQMIELPGGIWRIESSSRGYCLNIKASSQNHDGAEPRLVRCASHPDQQWRILPKASDPTQMQLQSVSTGRCLNLHSGRENREYGHITVYACANTPDQYWQRVGEDAARLLHEAERQ